MDSQRSGTEKKEGFVRERALQSRFLWPKEARNVWTEKKRPRSSLSRSGIPMFWRSSPLTPHLIRGIRDKQVLWPRLFRPEQPFYGLATPEVIISTLWQTLFRLPNTFLSAFGVRFIGYPSTAQDRGPFRTRIFFSLSRYLENLLLKVSDLG